MLSVISSKLTCIYVSICTNSAGSGVFVCLLGVAFFANIHKLYYFIIIQFINGIFQVIYNQDTDS